MVPHRGIDRMHQEATTGVGITEAETSEAETSVEDKEEIETQVTLLSL